MALRQSCCRRWRREEAPLKRSRSSRGEVIRHALALTARFLG
jgi:hypothetical protein